MGRKASGQNNVAGRCLSCKRQKAGQAESDFLCIWLLKPGTMTTRLSGSISKRGVFAQASHGHVNKCTHLGSGLAVFMVNDMDRQWSWLIVVQHNVQFAAGHIRGDLI